MSMSMSNLWLICYEGEADVDQAPEVKPEDKKEPDTKLPDAKFTPEQQEHMNKILAEERRKHQTQVKKAVDELQALKKRSDLTSQERTDLEKRLENLQNEYLTKEEMAKRELDKIKKDREVEITTLKTEKETWQKKFTESTIMRNIVDAAVSNNAFHPDQIAAILRPNTRLDEVVDEHGKATGDYVVKVKLPDVDAAGKPVTLDLTIAEAVKQMKTMEKHFNLFKNEGVGGFGGMSRQGVAPGDAAALALKDPQAYLKARRQQAKGN